LTKRRKRVRKENTRESKEKEAGKKVRKMAE
jgi:hypothetical protein